MFIRKATFLALVICSVKLIGQRDTLRLYYSGLAVKLLDSNEVKIGNWANTLKGSKSDVEIHAYYDKSEFKDIAKQRIDDIALVIVRKARDYSNITFQGPKKADKSRRSRVDIIYTRPVKQEEQKPKE